MARRPWPYPCRTWATTTTSRSSGTARVAQRSCSARGPAHGEGRLRRIARGAGRHPFPPRFRPPGAPRPA
eukprot:4585065-Lingulodinium_polyedra.AAC.1